MRMALKESEHMAGLNLDFNHTPFDLLMQRRIRRILLICSSYDAFMLEEDGRVDEQIFNEYVSLNLRYPPTFIQVSTAREAMEKLKEEQIDLVIEMLNIADIEPFELAKRIKAKHPEIPVVLLTHFSREVSMKLSSEDLSAVDHVFSWLGNADLLLAIIKLIEDRMNAEHDIDVVGVQALLFVEDSIRYISSYLPHLYKIILQQSREFSKEALNEHQRMLRMRGRPKILLAKTYEEARVLFEKYKYNIIGVISDVSFKKGNKRNPHEKAGLDLARLIRQEDEFMPILLQSSDNSNAKYAEELGVGFLNKYSKNLTYEIRNYIVRNFAFGDFIFRDPETGRKVARAGDLQALQQEILQVPDKVLEAHTKHNDFSKWLNARAILPIAQMFKFLRFEDFDSIQELREYIHQSISNYRISKGRGVIAIFDKSSYDEYLLFTRIGEGSIGGKARGLAFINNLIEKHKLFNKWDNIVITVPRTVVISTDLFDEFMDQNDLFKIALSDSPDEVILDHFVRGRLPSRLHQDLYALVEVTRNPLAVRSSSKLEDSHYQPFAGIYSTYMLPNLKEDHKLMVEMITSAIKSVYASVYFKASKAYMAATSNVIDEEKMGIILQEVCGKKYGNYFYPTLSGVARSINFYPVKPQKSTDGMVNLAFGLGKYVVEGGAGLRFSPKFPKRALQLSTPDMVLKDTQKVFYALDLSADSYIVSTDDGINLRKLRIKDAEKNSSFRLVTSTYDMQNHVIRDGDFYEGKKVITFSNILNHEVYPIADILGTILETSQKEMGIPVEIEFAANLDVPEGDPAVFNYLQIRPIVLNEQTLSVKLDQVKPEDTLIMSDSALGNGTLEYIRDVVYIKPGSWDPSKSRSIARMVSALNDRFIEKKKNYILIGPGRWGSSDHWLGIPIKWNDISQARVIVESGLDHYRIDPSQGTHFFQNLTSFQVGYFTINPFINDGYYDLDYLDEQKAAYEDEYLRHVHFGNPLRVRIDGKNNKAVIYKARKSKR